MVGESDPPRPIPSSESYRLLSSPLPSVCSSLLQSNLAAVEELTKSTDLSPKLLLSDSRLAAVCRADDDPKNEFNDPPTVAADPRSADDVLYNELIKSHDDDDAESPPPKMPKLSPLSAARLCNW